VILTVARDRVAHVDWSLEADIPPGLPVWRANSLEMRRNGYAEPMQEAANTNARSPSTVSAVLRRIRRPLSAGLAHAYYFPDRHNTWFPDAVRRGLAAIRHHRVDLLFSSAAPFTNHLVALTLHGLTGLPLVLELRDGWQRWNQAIFPDYPSWRGVLESALERTTFQHAARIVLVTAQSAAAFRGQYPGIPSRRFVVVPNGFDPRDFRGLTNAAATDGGRSDRFTVVHAGSLYFGRSCADFLDTVVRLARARPEFASNARVRLIGNLDQTARSEIERRLAVLGESALVERLPYVPHAQVVSMLRDASVLLLIVNTTPGGGTAVPGKLYEYLAVGRCILCIAPPGAEAADIVMRTKTGVVVTAGDRAALEREVMSLFDRWLEGSLAPERVEHEILRYQRARLTRELAAVFDAALHDRPCGPKRSSPLAVH
jgi:glycosyltransferase involved in cell wall biosynthesis